MGPGTVTEGPGRPHYGFHHAHLAQDLLMPTQEIYNGNQVNVLPRKKFQKSVQHWWSLAITCDVFMCIIWIMPTVLSIYMLQWKFLRPISGMQSVHADHPPFFFPFMATPIRMGRPVWTWRYLINLPQCILQKCTNISRNISFTLQNTYGSSIKSALDYWCLQILER